MWGKLGQGVPGARPAAPNQPARAAVRPAFSLVEIVIALAVLLALGALIWPALSERVGRARLEFAQEAVASALVLTRADAMREGRARVLLINADAQPVVLGSLPYAALGSSDAALTELVSLPAGAKVSVVGASARAGENFDTASIPLALVHADGICDPAGGLEVACNGQTARATLNPWTGALAWALVPSAADENSSPPDQEAASDAEVSP